MEKKNLSCYVTAISSVSLELGPTFGHRRYEKFHMKYRFCILHGPLAATSHRSGLRQHNTDNIDNSDNNCEFIRRILQHFNTIKPILSNDQLDTQLLYFTISLLPSSACFEHYMLIFRSLNCIDAASGIVIRSKWPSGVQVERELHNHHQGATICALHEW